jgi:hypothetical protein
VLETTAFEEFREPVCSTYGEVAAESPVCAAAEARNCESGSRTGRRQRRFSRSSSDGATSSSRGHTQYSRRTAEGVADELELAVVASVNEGAMRMEVELLLPAWEAARRAKAA